jgi:hypothetical protein
VVSVLSRTGVVVLARASDEEKSNEFELVGDDALVSAAQYVHVCASPATLRDYPG